MPKRADAGNRRAAAIASTIWTMILVVLVFGLSSCGGESPVGEVAIKVAPGFIVPPLAIQQDKFFSDEPQKLAAKGDGSPTILHRYPGRFNLLYQVSEKWKTACSFEIKQHRVVTVTISMVNREAKCDVVS